MRLISLCLLLIAAFWIGLDDAWAQASLFRAPADVAQQAAPSGIIAWIAARQADFYRVLINALAGFRGEPYASWWLVAASFTYGVFHAAGPGHGKAVLGSYMLASRAAARRGVLLALSSSMVQGLTALMAVGILTVAFKATGAQISDNIWTLERISFAILTLFGMWLLWTKLLRPMRVSRKEVHHDHSNPDHVHGPGCGCDHVHIPDAATLEVRIPLGQALALIFSIGMRPCSGAIIVMVFAITQGLVWAGALSVFAISLGTAITVSMIVLGAVGGRSLLVKLAGGADTPGAQTAYRAIEGLGATMVFGFGLILFLGTFGPRPPLY